MNTNLTYGAVKDHSRLLVRNTVACFSTICFCLLALRATAATYYVDINSPNPTPPYTSWSTAATDIQDAVAETFNGDSVLVNPGVYQPVTVTNAISIQGVSGPATTLINGGNTVRCITLANGATLAGFTLTNGMANDGGGVYCASTVGTLISNCVITANTAVNAGGGVYQGTLFNCTITQNSVESSTGNGGGAYDSVLIACMVISNSIFGGQGIGVYDSDVTNSLIANNAPSFPNLLLEYTPTYGGGAYGGNLDHCNITGNSASDGGGTYEANLVNCINYFNSYDTNFSAAGSSNYDRSVGGAINYTCTAPNSPGTKNIAGDPQLASSSHISLTSPCRGAGTATASSGVDIDGNPWADPPSMGCFEPYPGSVLGNPTVSISTPYTNWAPGFGLNFQANISGPVYSNVWSFGDGTFITNETYLSHIWSAAGTYPVTLTAYNDSYPAGIVATQIVSVAVPTVYYVNLDNFNPVPPYITPATAAMNIQDAVNVATPGSLVLVTNGVTLPTTQNDNITNNSAFYLNGGATAPDGNIYRVVITNAVTVQSVNGPGTTFIFGYSPGSLPARTVYLTNGAVLSGFTVTNYSDNSQEWQISATSTNALITNCVLTEYVTANSGTFDNCTFAQSSDCNNSALNNCSLVGSGAVNSTLNNCVVSNNSQITGGILNNCVLVDNTNSTYADSGAIMAESGFPLVLNNCILSNNAALNGGVVYDAVAATPNYYTNCVLNNCTLTRNFAQSSGFIAAYAELNNCLINSNTGAFDGAMVEGGWLANCSIIGNSNSEVASATLTNCSLVANIAGIAASSCTLDQCTIAQTTGDGAMDCTLNQCTLSQNAGIGAANSALINCLLISNSPPSLIGGRPTTGGGAGSCELTNCILVYNAATNGGAAYRSTLVNCTVVANTAFTGGGIYQCTADNCIVYRNTGGDFYPNTSQYPLNYCCVSSPGAYGIRDITNVPVFTAPGNYHLQSSSPCINSGNNAFVTAAIDLDGNPRIVGGTVDIGAYEYQTPTSVISYAYLQQYGLPIDGSVDLKDLDGTAFDVYQDWIAGLNPTNPASVLAMLTPVTTNTATGVIVTWQSVSGIPYLLQRSTNLVSQPPFSIIQGNITGQTNTTSYTDTSATNGVPYFYRVGVMAP